MLISSSKHGLIMHTLFLQLLFGSKPHQASQTHKLGKTGDKRLVLRYMWHGVDDLG